MFISKYKYYELCDKAELNYKLEEEIKKLEYLLNTRERTCKVGPWCEKCGHWVEDHSRIISNQIDEYSFEDAYYGVPLPEYIGGRVGYCNKYINTLCPDFTFKEELNNG